ncbi:AmmeMemoRadiSam system protein B [Candidatus Uhrbacteria bacterium]|nr:MAG: AmmeMemoRadiSam system protein B [Candidatus Uhrbacteria bacterium]
MIVSAAIVPHTPLLAETVGKEHREKLTQTIRAMTELAQALYLAKPDTLVMISPHAPMYPDAFSGNVAPMFKAGLKEFGDHGTVIPIKANFLLLDHIHRHMRDHGIPFTLSSSEELDYGFTIPLLFLTNTLPGVKLVPLAVSMLDAQAHYTFGQELKNVIHAENNRVAVIASADLSHHSNTQSPDGYLPEGEAFDRFIREKAAVLDGPGLLAADPGMIEKAGQSGYKPIVVLAGCLENMNLNTKELSYEAPFGVGLMTMRYDLA